jgi:hypothetical protein
MSNFGGILTPMMAVINTAARPVASPSMLLVRSAMTVLSGIPGNSLPTPRPPRISFPLRFPLVLTNRNAYKIPCRETL